MKKVLLLLGSFPAGCFHLAGQEADGVEMADLFRSSGKIYVVVAVLVIILGGVLIYLWRIDRRISKMEKDLKIKEDNSTTA